MFIALDHLVIAATDLDSGEAWLRERLGVALEPGGQHEGRGTHNRLLNLGGTVYLELIAADPTQPDPPRPRSFMLDEPDMKARVAQQPQFIHYLARTDDIDAALASLRYDVGQPSRMTRGELQWRITALGNGRPPEGGLLPTIIQWDVPPALHPSAKLPPSPVRLTGLAVHAPAALLARMPALSSPVPLTRVISDATGLKAHFMTPRGAVSIG